MADPTFELRSFQSDEADRPSEVDDDLLEATEAWDAIRSSAAIHRVRWHTGLSQAEFAQVFHIDPDYLRALERGAVQPDGALLAYLTVIDRAPDTVRAALQTC